VARSGPIHCYPFLGSITSEVLMKVVPKDKVKLPPRLRSMLFCWSRRYTARNCPFFFLEKHFTKHGDGDFAIAQAIITEVVGPLPHPRSLEFDLLDAERAKLRAMLIREPESPEAPARRERLLHLNEVIPAHLPH
jgi:hypothetical protein